MEVLIMKKKLYKSKTNRKVCGVCAGLADYLDIDPIIIRLVWVALLFIAGTGVLAYFIAAIIMDDEPDVIDTY